MPNLRVEDQKLAPIAEKILAGERLNFEEGVALYRSNDLLALGYLANHVREKLHGKRTYFNVNRHINPTNVCVASCKLCAFGRKPDAPGAYTMALEEAFRIAGEGWTEAITEFHIVGGLHPELTLDWYCELLRGLKQRFPNVHLKAFTMVEIGYFAQRFKIPVRDVLLRLKDAGMDSMPGGGAEIFADRVRALIGAFSGNHLRFHAHDGSGYRLVGEVVRALDPINPQIAARLAGAFENWRRYDPQRQNLMRAELQATANMKGLSANLFEIVTKMLG